MMYTKLSDQLLGSDRFTLKNENKQMVDFYYKQRSILWQPDEISFKDDKKDYENAKPNYKRVYKLFLEFFVSGDGCITEQAMNFAKNAFFVEERMFLLAQLLNEQDHMITYTRAIKEVIPVEEQAEVFDSIDNNTFVKAKGDFITKWCESDNTARGVKYLAGAFAEGTFFTALFSLIFYFRRKNIFQRFITANQYIMRDETLHRDFNCYMAKMLNGGGHSDFDAATAHQIAKEAFDIEIEHMEYILSHPIDTEESDRICGLTKENMKDYIATLTDQILVLVDMPPLFNTAKSTLPWMEDIGLMSKKNFYETEVTDYSISNAGFTAVVNADVAEETLDF